MALLVYILGLTLALLASPLKGLYRNYQLAKAQHLPVIIGLAGTGSPFWILVYRVFPFVLPIVQALPFGLGRWSEYTYIGWTYHNKYHAHATLGPAFIICTPWLLEVVIAEPEATVAILNDRKAFIKPQLFYDALNMFGRNVDAIEGADWARHRRITAPSFNEKVSSTVWKEAISQASQMRDIWLKQGEKGTNDSIADTVTLALHVLTSAGFGISYSFTDASKQVPEGHQHSYRDVLYTVLQNFTLLTAIPMQHLTKAWLPRTWQKVGHACIELKTYMRETVLEEKANTKASSNLLSAMVRVSEDAGKSTGHGLSDDELYGNIFIYSMAGHETTANTLGSAVAYLAADPRWQSWIRKELEDVLHETPAAEWDYENTFSKLKRCLAVMYETLRLHAPAPFIPKESTSLQTISIASKPKTFPSNSWFVVNMQALHTDPRFWGEDALQFRPDRWIVRDDNGQETFFEPPEGRYLPWKLGPRSCPGRKFSQVEFVAALAVLFREHAVDSKIRGAESLEASQERLKRTIEDSGFHGITLQITRPKDIELVWKSVSSHVNWSGE